MKKGGDDDDDKDEKPVKREQFVETPPSPPQRVEPVWEEPVQEKTEGLPLVGTGYSETMDTSLEERVEALNKLLSKINKGGRQ